jgi:HEAT repeat protein
MGVGDPSSIRLLNGLLQDPNAGIRLSAVAAMDELAELNIGNASSLGPLKKLLNDKNSGIRVLCVICLCSLASYLRICDENTIPQLNSLLSDDDGSIRMTSTLTLRQMSRCGIGIGSSIRPLEGLLTDKDDEIAEAAAEAIAGLALNLRIGERSSVTLLNSRIQRKGDESCRSADAIGCLAKIGIGERTSIEPLNQMMSSTKEMSVEKAVSAIGNLAKIGFGDASSLECLDAVLKTHSGDQINSLAEDARKLLLYII